MANAFYFYFRISIYFYNFYSLCFVLFVSLFVCCNFVILGKLFIDWSKNKLQRAALGQGRRRQRHNLLCFVFYLLFILNWIVSFTFFYCILYLLYCISCIAQEKAAQNASGRACVVCLDERVCWSERSEQRAQCELRTARTAKKRRCERVRTYWRIRCDVDVVAAAATARLDSIRHTHGYGKRRYGIYRYRYRARSVSVCVCVP